MDALLWITCYDLAQPGVAQWSSLPGSPGPAKRDAGGRQLVAPSQGTGTYFIQSLYAVCPGLRRKNKVPRATEPSLSLSSASSG